MNTITVNKARLIETLIVNRDEIELEQHDFQCYVQNQWRWAASFAGTTQSYVAS